MAIEAATVVPVRAAPDPADPGKEVAVDSAIVTGVRDLAARDNKVAGAAAPGKVAPVPAVVECRSADSWAAAPIANATTGKPDYHTEADGSAGSPRAVIEDASRSS